MRKTAAQLEFEKVNGWGGKRRKAGRPNRSKRQGHAARPLVSKSVPMHITWKLKKDVVGLRCEQVVRVFRISAEAVQIYGFRLIHFSLLNDHIHLFVEADDKTALSKGMRSFGCRFGKGIRRISGGTGPVFADRYHVRLLKTPAEVRNALAYVLQNFSKHSNLLNHVDEFSCAPYFPHWKTLLGKKMGPILEDLERRRPPLPGYLCHPKSWLAREGWMKAKVYASG